MTTEQVYTVSCAKMLVNFIAEWIPEVTTGEEVNGADLVEYLTNLYNTAREIAENGKE